MAKAKTKKKKVKNSKAKAKVKSVKSEPAPTESASVSIPGPDVGYTDLLNHETTTSIAETFSKPKTHLPTRPSSSGKCTRELAYELMEYSGAAMYEKEPYTPEIHRVFSLGHSIEWHIIKQFEALTGEWFNVKYKQQTLSFFPLQDVKNPDQEILLEGSMDLAFFSDKWKCVADVKSKKEKFSSWFKDDWDQTDDKLKRMESVETISSTAYWVENLVDFLEELNDPFFAGNFLQLNLYANSQFLKDRGVDHGVIIQYSKNTSRLREIRFKPSQELYEAIQEKFTVATEAAIAKKPEAAPRSFRLGSIKCAFCDYSKECRANDNTLQAFFQTFPKKAWPKDTNRLGQLGAKLEKMYDGYKKGLTEKDKLASIETEMIDILLKEGVKKVKFSDGNIYEVAFRKSPREHFILKRGKL